MKFLRAVGMTNELRTLMDINATASNRKVVSSLSADRRTATFKLALDSPLPVNEWALLFGDMVHNLRSALDSLAWELAHMDGAAPDARVRKQIYFPLCTTQAAWEAKLAGPLATVPEQFRAALYELQPLRHPDPRDAVVLALHEFDIVDKHKSCVYASTMTHNLGAMIIDLKDDEGNKISFDPHSLSLAGPGPFEDGQPLFSVSTERPIAIASSPMNVPVQLLLQLDDGRTVGLWNFIDTAVLYLNVVFDVIYKGREVDFSSLGWR